MSLCVVGTSGFGSFLQLPWFFNTNFQVLVIHDLVVHLVSNGELLDNRVPEKPISSLSNSIEFLRCYHVMQSLFLSSSVTVYVCALECVRESRF